MFLRCVLFLDMKKKGHEKKCKSRRVSPVQYYSPEIFRRQNAAHFLVFVDLVYILGERDSTNFVFVEWSIEIKYGRSQAVGKIAGAILFEQTACS